LNASALSLLHASPFVASLRPGVVDIASLTAADGGSSMFPSPLASPFPVSPGYFVWSSYPSVWDTDRLSSPTLTPLAYGAGPPITPAPIGVADADLHDQIVNVCISHLAFVLVFLIVSATVLLRFELIGNAAAPMQQLDTVNGCDRAQSSGWVGVRVCMCVSQ
jgi:hypothetical protein